MESEALADAPEDATVDEMRRALRVMELNLRNVDVPYDDPCNRSYASAFSKFRTRVMVLRDQSTSAAWSPSFLRILQRSRYAEEVPMQCVDALACEYGTASESPPDAPELVGGRVRKESTHTTHQGTQVTEIDWIPFEASIACDACVSKKPLKSPSVALDIVGDSVVFKRTPQDDETFLLTCKFKNLHTRMIRRIETDQKIAERPDVPDICPKMPHAYRGRFVLGPKCHVMAHTYVWLQNLLANIVHCLEERLDMMTDEELKMPVADFSIVTSAAAKRVVEAIEKAETLLRDGMARPSESRVLPSIQLFTGDEVSDEPEPGHRPAMGGIEFKLWCTVRDKVMRCIDRTIVSPRGRGSAALIAYMEENAENTMPVSEPWWYMEDRHHEWTPGQYRRCLAMRMCRQRCEASLSASEWAVGTLSGSASADSGQMDQEDDDEAEGEEGEQEVVVLDGELADDPTEEQAEEQPSEQTEANNDEESIEVVEEEEDDDEEEEDERALRRKRRAQSRDNPKTKTKSAIQKRPKPPRKRRAVVEDDEDEEDQDDQDLHEHVNAQSGGGPSTHHKLPDSVRRMRFYRVADASKTHVYIVPGTNLVGIIEHI